MSPTRIAIIDPFCGISGDMLLGALVDLDIDVEQLSLALETLALPGFALQVESMQKKGIACKKVNVVVNEEHHTHRKLQDVAAIVKRGQLPQRVVERSIEAFQRIAEAEGKIHGKPSDEVHFHEVGAFDAIVDIAGSLLAVDMLGIERCYCSSIPVGTGQVKSAHGTLPVPCPASLEILQGFPIEPTDIRQELVTPTGAALLRTLVEEPGFPPEMTVERIGYGAGTRETPERPNALRIMLGQTGGEQTHIVSLLETTIDDMNPEVYGYLLDRIFEQGALDAFLTPVYGKKNRPAVLITILCAPHRESSLASLLLKETTTLGVRSSRGLRYCLARKTETVETRWGAVRVKVAQSGSSSKFAPEYEDCLRIAKQEGVPILEVYREVQLQYGGE